MKTPLIFALTLVIACGLGYWLSQKNDLATAEKPASVKTQKKYSPDFQPENRSLKRNARLKKSTQAAQQEPPFALNNERIIRFKDDAAYRKFLASLDQRGLRLLGQSDRLRSVRVGLGFDSDLSGLEEAEQAYNYAVDIPVPPQASAQDGALGFGQDALSWLGVLGDNSHWGQGVTVAVIDSGVNEHIALQGDIANIELTALPEGSEQLGHGTAVASIISGDHRLAPGVAPASEIVSIRVTDETGSSNSFTLAEGIMQAADAGAEVINISMGSYGDSSMVADAVAYAQDQGAVIVASSGNEGLDTMAYPAAYDGVISVGAVEQAGNHLDFSNSSENLNITAPGFEVNAAWGDEQLTAFSGTSASAPFVSGAIAATMSEFPGISAQQAADLVMQYSNDAGYPGSDPQYGGGTLDIGRIMDHRTPDIYDAAITNQTVVMPEYAANLPTLMVTIQNQGTETLINSPVNIITPDGTKNLNISSLAPGQTETFEIPFLLPYNGNPVNVSSTVISQEGDKDINNNSRSNTFAREDE